MSTNTTATTAARPGDSDYVLNMRFGVLGPIEAFEKKRRLPVGGPKQRTVLALLVARAGTPVSTDALVEGVYGDEPPQGARRSVQTYVSNLRGDLGDAIEAEGAGYRLKADRSEVDALHFEDAVAEAAEIDDPERASEILRDALALWRGHAYADVDGFFDLTAERSRLSELRMSAIEARVDSDLKRGHHRQLIAELDSLTEEHPLRERFRAQQMLALYRCGRQAEALRAYEKTRTYLVDEMGLDPSPDLRELEQQILDQDPSLGFETGPTVIHAAILVADIADPRILPTLDPIERYNIVTHQSDAIGEASEEHGGDVFAHRGSAIYVSFEDVEHAVGAAIATQQALAEHQQGMRMAISVGEVQIPQDEAVQGPPVTRAARLVSAAHGGQVLLSTEANQALAESGGAGWIVRSLGQHDVDGSGEGRPVYQLMVNGLERDFPPLRSELLPLPLPVASRGLPGYELREEVGSGAFGVVHRAYQPSVGREVAIKIVRPEYANDPQFIRRFEVEAQLVARLEHPHIVPLHDYWRNPDGAYLVMRWLGGGTLKDEVAEGNLTIDQAHSLLIDIGPALAFAHRRGVVHRDIKLSNVLLDDEGSAYLTDFGIASDIALHGVGSVAQDVQALAVLLSQCVGEPSEPEVAELLATATATEAFPDVRSFVAAWEEAARAGDSTSEAVGYTPTRNPYKGLGAFGELDATDFHGRDAEIDEIVGTLAEHPLVAVVGPSGIGKSSVVRAGMIPALRDGAIPGSDGWLITDMLPGAYPYEELASALMRVATEMPTDLEDDLRRDARGLARSVKRYVPDGQTVLLIVDQFEELFTLSSENERTTFLAMLAATINDERSIARIVITMRADFFDRPLRFADLGDALRAGTIPISAPSDEGLHAIVTAPSAGVGVAFEPGLVDHIVGDVKHQPGALPLLEFSLTELFDQRDSDLLTLEAYEASGGVLGALGRRTEATYADLELRSQEAAQETFLRLVNVSEAGRDTRRRVRLTELERLGFTDIVLRNMLNAFGDHRLLTFDRDPVTRGPTIEVAHEAILTEWPRLAAWIDEHREDLLLRSRLAVAVADWEAADRSDTYLLTRGRLDQHEAWTTGTGLSLTSAEEAYLTASRVAEDERTAQRRRTRRLVMSGFGAAAIIALVLAAIALLARDDARDQANLAETNRITAEENEALAQDKAAEAEANAARAADSENLAVGRELAASAINKLDQDPELSLLLALQAASIAESSPETIAAIHQALGSHRTILTWQAEDGVPAASGLGVLSPDGTRLIVSPGFDRFSVLDVTSGDELWTKVYPGETDVLVNPMFAANGAEVAMGVVWIADGPPPEGTAGVYVYDTETGVEIRRFDAGPAMGACGPNGFGFRHSTPTATLITVQDCGWGGSLAPTVSRFDLLTGAVTDEPVSGTFRATITEDERFIASGGNPVTVTDRSTGEVVFATPEDVGMQVASISPDGSLLVVLGDGLEIYDVAEGRLIQQYHDHPGGVWNAYFSRDGEVVYSAGPDGVIRIWEPRSGRTLLELPYGDSLWMSGMSDDKSRLVAFSLSGPNAKVFDLSDSATAEVGSIPRPTGCTNPYYYYWNLESFGSSVMTFVDCDENEGLVQIWDTETQTNVALLDGVSGVSARTMPDRNIVAVQSWDGVRVGNIVLRDIGSGEVIREFTGFCPWKAFAEQPSEECAAFPSSPFADIVYKMDLSPDGRQLGSTVYDNDAFVVWDVESGGITTTMGLDAKIHAFEFSPDGKTAVLGTTLELLVLDTSTWEPITTRSFDGEAAAPDGAFAYTQDGHTLVAAPHPYWGGPDIFVLDPLTLETVAEIRGAHEAGVRSIAVTSDGSLIASGGLDGVVRVWDSATQKLVHTFPLGAAEITNVAFINDDLNLMASPSGGPVVILTMDAGELLSIARSRLTRGLTARECSDFNIDPCPTLEEMKND